MARSEWMKLPKAPKDPEALSAARNRYVLYRNSATKRGLSFSLTFGQFLQITQANCTYCGTPPYQAHSFGLATGHSTAHRSRPYRYNGIDRWDNRKGYIAGNMVPCCGKCNVAKGTMPGWEYHQTLQDVEDSGWELSSDTKDATADQVTLVLSMTMARSIASRVISGLVRMQTRLHLKIRILFAGAVIPRAEGSPLSRVLSENSKSEDSG